MRLGRSTRRLVSWIACLAILVGALAPALSHALQSPDGSTWVEVCSALGARLVQVDAADDTSSPAPAGPLLEHCPYCSLHASDLALPPAALPIPVFLTARAGPPERFFSSPRTLFAWAAAQPRAPPTVS
ncbi:MAG: DUF2946 domain-containing protein [Rhizobacter sp.]